MLAAGCSLAPEFTRPALPVADEYPTDAPMPPVAKPDVAPTAAEVAWRDYFADPQLQALIAQALEENRDLRVAVLRVSRSERLLPDPARRPVPDPQRERGRVAVGNPREPEPVREARTPCRSTPSARASSGGRSTSGAACAT